MPDSWKNSRVPWYLPFRVFRVFRGFFCLHPVNGYIFSHGIVFRSHELFLKGRNELVRSRSELDAHRPAVRFQHLNAGLLVDRLV